MTKRNGSIALMEALLEEGVEVIFGYPGGAIMPVYDALYHYQDRIRHVLVRHEQGASHAAEGYARLSGKPGVCLATSGPGATNLVTGIADALMDSVPLVCITGQVHRKALGTDAFQETDIIGITMPVTKWNYQVTNAEEIPWAIERAFRIARSGRPGPVLIDITKNAQLEECAENAERSLSAMPLNSDAVLSREYGDAAELINHARKPMIFAGNGVLIAEAQDSLRAFAEKAGIPVACTLHGLSAVPSDHPLYVGMLGMHGNYGANVLTNEADLIVAVGMRFDDRVTGDLSTYAKKARVVHLEIDPAEVNKCVKAEVALIGCARQSLEALLPLVDKREHPHWLAEFRKCDQLEDEKVVRAQVQPASGGLKMGEVVRVLSEQSAGEAVVVADVGQHQMMAARYYGFQRPRSFISSGGLGTMGFALPAGIGAKIAVPDREVVVVVGDGGFQMTLQELATVFQEGLAVKVVILNNQYLGMVRQWQELFFDNRYSFVSMKNPDFVKVAQGFGIEGRRISERADLQSAVAEMLASPKAYLLEVLVEKEDNVFPMVPAGASVSAMRLE